MPPRKKRPSYETENTTLPTRLRGVMEEKNISRSQLAEAVGVSVSAIGQYCTVQSKPSYEKLVSISRFLHEPIDYLLGATESRSVDLIDREICNRTNLTDEARQALSDLPRSGNLEKDVIVFLINEIIETLCRDPAFLNNLSRYWLMNQEIIGSTKLEYNWLTKEYETYDPAAGGALALDPDGDEMTLLRVRIDQAFSRMLDAITDSSAARYAASAFTKAYPERFWKDADGNIGGPIWYTHIKHGAACYPVPLTAAVFDAVIKAEVYGGEIEEPYSTQFSDAVKGAVPREEYEAAEKARAEAIRKRWGHGILSEETE